MKGNDLMLGNKEVMAKNIKRHMKMKNIDRKKLSKDIDVKYTTLTDWINANTYPRIDKIEKLANYFGISKSELVEEPKVAMEQIKPHVVPVISKISAGLPIEHQENIIDYAFMPSNLVKPNKEYFYLIVDGDSMNKEFNNGDLLLVEKDSIVENGQIGIVAINGYDATVKRVRYDNDKIVLIPESTNPDNFPQVYDKNDEVHILGRVISVQKFY